MENRFNQQMRTRRDKYQHFGKFARRLLAGQPTFCKRLGLMSTDPRRHMCRQRRPPSCNYRFPTLVRSTSKRLNPVPLYFVRLILSGNDVSGGAEVAVLKSADFCHRKCATQHPVCTILTYTPQCIANTYCRTVYCKHCSKCVAGLNAAGAILLVWKFKNPKYSHNISCRIFWNKLREYQGMLFYSLNIQTTKTIF